VTETTPIAGWQNAIELVLKTAQPGELWLVQADTIDETVNSMKALKVNNHVLREVTLKDVLEGTPAPPKQKTKA
jgi:hypothetical protein